MFAGRLRDTQPLHAGHGEGRAKVFAVVILIIYFFIKYFFLEKKLVHNMIDNFYVFLAVLGSGSLLLGGCAAVPVENIVFQPPE